MPVRLNGSTSGYVDITAPAVAGTTTVTLPSSTSTLLSSVGNQTTTGTVVMGSSFLRNRIINGDMRIDQRNAGASVTQNTSTTYTVDRWQIYGTVTSKFTAQQNAGSVTPPTGFTNYLGCTSSSSYAITSTDRFQIAQPIEGYNMADLGWGTASAKSVTLSFQVYSSLTGTFGGAVFNYNGSRSYPFSYTISSANTWTSISVTITGDTTGTWFQSGSPNAIGLNVCFSLGAGSTLSGTAGSWAGAFYVSATGATSVVGTNGATFYITGVQLEVGTAATPFEQRLYGQELMLCRRYFKPIAAGLNTQFLGYGSSGINQGYTIPFGTPMRAAPTVTVYDGVPTAGKIYFNGNGVSATVDFVTTDQFRIYASTPTTGAITFALDWQASAEL